MILRLLRQTEHLGSGREQLAHVVGYVGAKYVEKLAREVGIMCSLDRYKCHSLES
jgi:hypothetical protein